MAAQTAQPAPPGRRIVRRVLWYVVVIAVGFVLAYWALLFFMQDRMLFPRDLAPRPPRAFAPRDAEIWTLDIGEGKVEAWFLPAPGANSENPVPAVVHFHGNAEVIDYQDDVIAFYRSRGFAVLLPEYRGYGRSAGEPSQEAIREDTARFYERMIARPDVDKSRVVYSGRSVGSGVAADFASLHKPAAMVLVSPFLSASAMAREYYAPPLLVRNPYRSDKVLRELDVPVLIFHGKRDEIIPFRHGRELCRLAKRGQLVEYDCGHNDFPGAGNEKAFDEAVERFLVESGLIRG